MHVFKVDVFFDMFYDVRRCDEFIIVQRVEKFQIRRILT